MEAVSETKFSLTLIHGVSEGQKLQTVSLYPVNRTSSGSLDAKAGLNVLTVTPERLSYREIWLTRDKNRLFN